VKKRLRDPFTIGAILLAVTVVLLYVGFTKSIPFFEHGYEIKAAFRDSEGIRPQSPVRIAGVEVGRVTKVEHLGTDSAVVTMKIQDKGRPLHADTRAQIRPRIFLEGNFFVQLSPGTPNSPQLKSGATIPVEHTSDPVQFDQVLGALRSDTRADLRNALIELGRTERAGGAHALNRSLKDQPAAYKYSAIVADALLGRQPHDLGDFIRDGGTVAGALDRFPAQLRSLIVDFNRTAAALAARNADLGAAVHELPRTLDAAMPALRALNDAFPAVRALAREARPAIRSTGPAARRLIPLVDQATGLVGENELRGLSRDLRAATPGLASLSKNTVPFLEQLRLIASCTSNVLVPFGNDTVPDQQFKASGPVHEELAKFLPGLAGESRSFDANGQWFKVLGTGGSETVSLGDGLFGTSLFPLAGVNPPPQRARPPLEPNVACETQQRPDLGSTPQKPPSAVNTDNGSQAVQTRSAAARVTAIALMRKALRDAGSKLQVLDKNATTGDLRALADRTGKSAQLRRALDAKGGGG
jgi:phospholipid/cholesterol/gamma-HCH transport system substrate-binding protein